MFAEELRQRTRRFALDIIVLCSQLGSTPLAHIVQNQLLRAATSVAANYRAVCRSRSRREFIARLGIVVEECDESEFWLDMAQTNRLGPADKTTSLRTEASELLAVLSRSRRTAAERLRSEKSDAAGRR